MNTRFQLNSIFIVLLIAVSFLSAKTQAQTSLLTSGDICAPVNVGKSIRTIQNIRGNIVNISSNETIAVSCPVITFYPTTSVAILVGIENIGTVTQSPRCVLRELDLANFIISTEAKSIEVGAGRINRIFFEDVVLSDPLNRLNLTCSLPPSTALGPFLIDSF